MTNTTPDLAIGTRVQNAEGRTGTVRESWGHSAGVQWDDAMHAVPWYRSETLAVITEESPMTDRKLPTWVADHMSLDWFATNTSDRSARGPKHQVTITYGDNRGYRAVCSCGHRSPCYPTQSNAVYAGDEHARTANHNTH